MAARRRKYGVDQPLVDRAAVLAPGIGSLTAQQQIQWLKRSSQWPGLQQPGASYVGKRVLGAGAIVIAGLWERQQKTCAVR